MRQSISKLIGKLTLFFFFIGVGPVHVAMSQEEIVDTQLWFDFIPHFKINKRLEYFGDNSYRTSISGSKFNKLVLKPSIRYNWTYELDVIGGVGFFLTGEEDDYNTFELRPYQGVRLNWPQI